MSNKIDKLKAEVEMLRENLRFVSSELRLMMSEQLKENTPSDEDIKKYRRLKVIEKIIKESI
jgi:archaellum component FlaC